MLFVLFKKHTQTGHFYSEEKAAVGPKSEMCSWFGFADHTNFLPATRSLHTHLNCYLSFTYKAIWPYDTAIVEAEENLNMCLFSDASLKY